MNFLHLTPAARRIRKVLRGFAALLIFAPSLAAAAPAEPRLADPRSPALAPEALIAVDDYGYTLSDVGESWIDLNSGNAAEVVFTGFRDDDVSAELSIGFNFKFYETTFTTYYVSTNGLLTFGGGSNSPNPKPFPWAPTPNNLVGPFWADHKLQNGKVWRATFGAAPNRYTVVEWEIYADAGLTELVTNFEIVLRENGDILFQYNALPTPMPFRYTIGIEDANGVNGLQYDDPPQVGVDLLFDRPSQTSRVNVMPRVQGAFAAGGAVSFSLTIINNGESGPDRYNLTATSSTPGWDHDFFIAHSSTKLSDTDADGIIDTGPLAMGASVKLTVMIYPPAGVQPGDHTTLTVKAKSRLGLKPEVSAVLQTAVPTAFAQAYVDPYGIHFGQYWEKNSFDWLVSSTFGGPTLNMAAVTDDNYITAWEYSPIFQAAVPGLKQVEPPSGVRESLSVIPRGAPDSDVITEIFYRLVNRFTGSGAERLLTECSVLAAPVQITEAVALVPVMATAPDGNIAIAWAQVLARGSGDTRETNANIYLAILNAAGARISQRFSVTGESGWYLIDDSRQQDFPAATVSDSGAYIVCWTEDFNRQVKCRAHGFNGSQIVPAAGGIQTVATTAENSLPLELTLSRLSDGTSRTLVTFVESSEDLGDKIKYAVINDDATVAVAAQELAGVEGDRPRAVQFGNGNILMIWVNADGRLGYTYLGGDFNPLGIDGFFEKVDRRSASSPSIALDHAGRAVVTWMDGDDSDALFYALLQDDGEVLTPAMTFLSSPLGETEISTSDYGFGTAAYIGMYQGFMPLIRKR